jgi:hypothetical protein
MAATITNVSYFLEVRGDTVLPDQPFTLRRDHLKVIVPDKIERIGDNAFYGCSGLVELSLPNTLTAIGEHAFRGCSGLVELSLPDSLTAISRNAFAGCFGLLRLSLPNTLTAIGCMAFQGCSGLVKLSLPDSLRVISSSAFAACSRLVELNLPGTLRAIGVSAFQGCSGLVELILPGTLTAIGEYAFCECTNLRCVVLPPALDSLAATAFGDSMINLRMLVVPLTVSFEYATTVAATFGRGGEPNYSSDPDDTKWDTSEVVDFSTDSNIQLVSAPDAVVASLGGVFAEMATMSEVRAAGRAVSAAAEHSFWDVKTHLHQVCTRSQRVCAHTLLLVGARLYSQSAPRSTFGSASDPLSHIVVREAELRLPPLPDEVWVLVLRWLRRSDLGRH